MAARQSMNVAMRWTGRLVLSGVFGYAAVSKLVDPAAFAVDIGHFRLLPHGLTLVLAVYLPWLELICSMALLQERRRRGAALVLVVLCAGFTFALASA